MRRLTYGSEFIQSGGGLQALRNRGNRLKIYLATGANACLESVSRSDDVRVDHFICINVDASSKFNLRLNAEVFLFSASAKKFMQSVRLPSRTWMCGG